MADHGSCDLIVDSIQLESSPAVLSSLETVVGIAIRLLPSSRRPVATKPPSVDRSFTKTNVICVQATNINAFLCCENSG